MEVVPRLLWPRGGIEPGLSTGWEEFDCPRRRRPISGRFGLIRFATDRSNYAFLSHWLEPKESSWVLTGRFPLPIPIRFMQFQRLIG